MVALFMMAVLGTSGASAATGNLDDLFPPGNNGSSHGVGFIEGDTSGKGRQFFVFKTTGDHFFEEGDPVTFDIAHGRVATNVMPCNPDDPTTCP